MAHPALAECARLKLNHRRQAKREMDMIFRTRISIAEIFKAGVLPVVVALPMASAVVSSPAQARPPTVMNSPGYEARLAESRKAQQEYLRAAPTEAPPPKPVKHKRAKPKQ